MGGLTDRLSRRAQAGRRLGGKESGAVRCGAIEGAQTGKANRTDVSDVYNVFMTKAGGPKVCLVFRRDGDDFTNRGSRQEGHLGSVYMS